MAERTSRMDVEVEEVNKLKERDAEIEKLMQITDIIIDEAAAKTKEIRVNLQLMIVDLEVSDEISGVLMTVFTCLKKE